MKKIILAAIATASILSALQARDNAFIGVEYGFVKYDARIYYSTNQADLGEKKGNSTYNALKLGKYFGSHKFSLDVDSGRSIGFNYDYMFETPVENLAFYLGTGLYYQKTDYINTSTKQRGIFIPLALGIEYDIDESYSLNIGMRRPINTYEQTSDYLSYDSFQSRSYFISILYHLK